MKKNLWVTITENEFNGNLNITACGVTTFVSEESNRQLWSILKGATCPKLALSFIPPNHENAIRIVKDFKFETVRKFVADVLKTKEEYIRLLFNDTRQTLVLVDDETGEYTYRVDHINDIS